MSQFEQIQAELREIRAAVLALKHRDIVPVAMSLQDAATALGVSSKHIGRMVKRGELMTIDVGGARRIPMSEIERLSTPVVMASNRENPETERRVKYDAAAASRRLAELRKRR